MIRSSFLLFAALVACDGASDGRTAIVVKVTGESALSAADTFALFVNPESPYEGEDDCLGDWVLDDAATECRVNVPVQDGEFALVELQPGSNTSPFQLSGAGWRDDVQTVSSDTFGPFFVHPR